MLTKRNFTRDEWHHLLHLLKIMNFSMCSCSGFSFKQKAECHVEERSRKYSESGVGSGETETIEIGVKEPPECEERSPQNSSDPNSPENQEFDQSSVSSWSKTSTQSTQTQQCLLKRGNKMTLIFPAPGIWCGEMNLQTQPAPGNWSEVRTSNSEGRSYTSTICRSPTISTSKKSSRTCGKSWISQKEHQQWVLKLWRPTYWYGDYLCRQRWKPPFILDQISLNIWMYTETRTSKNCRICTISLRSWYLTITQRFWMWHRFIGQLHHGRELHLRMIKWSRWRTQKYASTQFPSNVWENARSLRSESMMGKSSTIISTVQFLQRIN